MLVLVALSRHELRTLVLVNFHIRPSSFPSYQDAVLSLRLGCVDFVLSAAVQRCSGLTPT